MAHFIIPRDFQLIFSEVTYQSFSNLRQLMKVETTSTIKPIKHFPNAKLCNKCHKLFFLGITSVLSILIIIILHNLGILVINEAKSKNFVLPQKKKIVLLVRNNNFQTFKNFNSLFFNTKLLCLFSQTMSKTLINIFLVISSQLFS